MTGFSPPPTMRSAHSIGEAPSDTPGVARRLRSLTLPVLNRILGLVGLQAGETDAVRAGHLALRHDYLWYNAKKKIDIRKIAGFRDVAGRTLKDGRTYLHYDRLYTLWQAVAAIGADAPAVAEVGAYKGGSARFIAESLRARGRSNRLYVCDTFEGHAVVDARVDGHHRVGHQFQSTSAEAVAHYLRDHDNVRIVKGDFQLTSAQLADEPAFAFAHIDVDVYPVTRFCLEFFADRLVRGGSIVVDDYGSRTCEGVKRAVDEFAAARADYRLFHLLTGQALLVRLAG
jgi:hypothetical protein